MVPRGGAFAVLALALCACSSSLRTTTAAASPGGVPAAAMAMRLGPAAEVRRPADTGGGGASNSASKRYESHMPVLLSALHAPDSAHQPMMLVDLSALHHHQEPAVGFQPDDYYGSSSSSNSMASADYGDTWEDNSLGADDRLYRRHQPHEEMHNDIGDSDQLLMPFLPENTVGLHYTGFPFIEDALHLQRQSSREDAFSDYLRALIASRDRKRSVFLSQSWQPGGHPGPSVPRRLHQTPPPQQQQQQQPRRVSQVHASTSPELMGLTDSKSSERELPVHHRHHPAVPFIFSSKGWHPGGRKRNFFFSRGWGPSGRPLTLRADYFKKKPPAAHTGGGEDASGNEASSLGLSEDRGVMGGGHGNSDSSPTVKATATRHGHRPCRTNCWRIPHLFGPYW
ncbi:uncharacterized protein LOC142582858 [Dermacentor variabilis]|uniref:uncharacterized protein LOC142582858 n=1 Tax=Dermacentor variabilis TaxID=34621 RepID=UPI003F5BF093